MIRLALVLYNFAHVSHIPTMLRYLGSGIRRFGLYPIPIHERGMWEFFVVAHGRCGAVFSDADAPALRQQHLWVFPPDIAHGWLGDRAQRCQVAVFHFGSVPPPLEKIVRAREYLERPLTVAQARRVARLEKELRPHYEQMTEKSLLVFEKALLELSLLALDDISFERTETKNDLALRKVEASLTWYSEHMAEQPKIEHVAQAVHVSVSHLRRLFWQARQESPQKSFTKLRLDRAMQLLSHTIFKLDVIAAKCGFSSASDFSRVFKSHHGISPDAWRRSKLGPYREPDPIRK